MQDRWIRIVPVVVALSLLSPQVSHAVKPHVVSIGEICTGDPCEVTGDFTVSTGVTFDLDGRALTLKSGSTLEGDSGASFSIIRAKGITMEKGSVINTIGRATDAGTLTITSSSPTAPCDIAGKIIASAARVGGVGGNGGTIAMTCAGFNLHDTAVIDASGVGGNGGQITLTAVGTAICATSPNRTACSTKGTKITANGTGGRGGSITLTSTSGCELASTMQVNAAKSNGAGGPGGTASLQCVGLHLGDGGGIDGSGAGDNFNNTTGGGTITLDAQTAPLVVDKAVKLKANGSASDGGLVQISSQADCTISGKILLDSVKVAPDSGGGGELDVTCNGILMDHGGVEAIGAAPFGLGGTINLTSSGTPGTIEVDKGVTLKATGIGAPGGEISLFANGQCDVGAKIQVDGKPVVEFGIGFGAEGGNVILGSTIGSVNLVAGAAISSNGSESVAGGTILLGAGAPGITIAKGVGAVADAKNGLGGLIALDSNGPCHVEGKLEAKGTGSFGSGGSLSLTCKGDISLTKDVKFYASGYKTAGSGSVLIAATPGMVTMDKGAEIHSDGVAQLGVTAIEIDASSSCLISGKLQADSEGAPGPTIQLTCSGLTLDGSASVQSNGKASTGGHVLVDTTGTAMLTPPGACDIIGKIKVNSSTKTDSSVQPPVVTPGTGGTVEMTCGTTLTVENKSEIDAIGSGTSSNGGTITLTAKTGAAEVDGVLKTKASATGGPVNVTGVHVITGPASNIDVGAFTAGTITLFSGQGPSVISDIEIGNVLAAKGAGAGANTGGTITAEGCNVTVDPPASMKTDGKQAGNNVLNAHNQLMVNGKVSALSSDPLNSNGINTFRSGVGAPVYSPSNVKPLPSVGVLTPCT